MPKLNDQGEPIHPDDEPYVMTKNERSRGWCFTIQTHSIEAFSQAACLFEDDENCTYVIIGWEFGSRTKQPHLQGYAYYRDAISTATMRKNLPGCHVEKQKSKSNVAAYCYCADDLQYTEWGERPRQGFRTDLQMIRNDLLSKKKDIKQISKEYHAQYLQYSRQYKAFVDMHHLEQYDTKLIAYDKSTYSKVYSDYDTHYALIYEDFFFGEYELLGKLYSKKYKWIFIPNRPGIEQYSELVDETLY